MQHDKQMNTKEYLEKVQELDTLQGKIFNGLPKFKVDEILVQIYHEAPIPKYTLDLYFEYWSKSKSLIKNIFGIEHELISVPFVTNQQKYNFLLVMSNFINKPITIK